MECALTRPCKSARSLSLFGKLLPHQSGKECVSVAAALRAESREYAREPRAESMPESGSEPVRARVGVTESHKEPGLLQKRGLPHIFSIPKHCFVADSFLPRHVIIRYFLSKNVKIRAKRRKNGCKCAESRLHTFSHSVPH